MEAQRRRSFTHPSRGLVLVEQTLHGTASPKTSSKARTVQNVSVCQGCIQWNRSACHVSLVTCVPTARWWHAPCITTNQPCKPRAVCCVPRQEIRTVFSRVASEGSSCVSAIQRTLNHKVEPFLIIVSHATSANGRIQMIYPCRISTSATETTKLRRWRGSAGPEEEEGVVAAQGSSCRRGRRRSA